MATQPDKVFVQSYELADSIRMINAAPGSTFRFNTVVNTSTITSSGVAQSCDASIAVASDIFAYNSTAPFPGTTCIPHSSLIDAPGMDAALPANGNVAADVSTFFADRATGDFHLSAQSPAKMLGAEAGVLTDVDGGARPLPAGTKPDAGAFEAP